MHATDKLSLMAELSNENCKLSHGPGIDTSKIPAINWLIIPLGDLKTQKETDKFAVPICQECQDGIEDTNWVLLYCIDCLKSQWVYKPASKIKYAKNIVLISGCPKCSRKAGSVFLI